MGKTTAKTLTNAGVEAERRPGEYPDAKVRGLALRVAPTGGKSWTVRYRLKDGSQRRLTLGKYPALGLANARARAQEAVGEVAKGGDPVALQKAATVLARSRRAFTVADLVEDYFADAESGRHRPGGRPKRNSTMTSERGYYDRWIKPAFGTLPIDQLTRHDLQRFLDEHGARAPSRARQCRNVIRQAFNYGIRREVTKQNPAQFSALPSSPSRERVLADNEVRAVWAAANDPAATEGLMLSPGVGLALCFALVTLQRGGEIAGIHAREIDAERRLWTLPGSRTKNHRTHVVPLSPLALQILGRAYALAGYDSERPDQWAGFAFPSPKGETSVARHALTKAMERVVAKVGVTNATPHDFRRTGSTNLTGERLGFTRFIVSRVLNQISDTGGAGAVTGVYDRNEYLAEKRRALEAWALVVAEIAEGNSQNSNVVNLARSNIGRTK